MISTGRRALNIFLMLGLIKVSEVRGACEISGTNYVLPPNDTLSSPVRGALSPNGSYFAIVNSNSHYVNVFTVETGGALNSGTSYGCLLVL